MFNVEQEVGPVRPRVAVMGLYNSGSTALAGMLSRMGVTLGPPFWRNSEEGHPENFYESRHLSGTLRSWWGEPLATPMVPEHTRIGYLLAWAHFYEGRHPGPIGAKHPLLSLCGPDLLTAWGSAARFIRCGRPLNESIDGLRRRGWFPGHEVGLQTRLWDALVDLERQPNANVTTVDWGMAKADPLGAARAVARAAGIDPSAEQLDAAAAVVHPPALMPLAA